MLKTALQSGENASCHTLPTCGHAISLGVPRAEACTDQRPETLLVSGGQSVAYVAQS